jgi:Crinkler effector protein N-terminal domain
MFDSDPNLTIYCWVLDDDYDNVFKVEISRNKNVIDLKESIKAEIYNLLKDIDAATLILYKVSIQHTPQLAEHVSALELADLRLHSFDDLSEVFANGLPRKHVHLVVEIPSGAWLYVVLSSLR